MKKSKKDDLANMEFILDSAKLIQEYLKDVEQQKFLNDYKNQDAVMYRLQMIGEASKNLSPMLKTKYSSLPWKEIIGFRNILSHDYFGINPEIIWNTCKESLPDLMNQIEKMIETIYRYGEVKP